MASIAIVGSGITGPSAARFRTQTGHQVTVFEADSRIGGHTHTVEVKIRPVALGGHWIHRI